MKLNECARAIPWQHACRDKGSPYRPPARTTLGELHFAVRHCVSCQTVVDSLLVCSRFVCPLSDQPSSKPSTLEEGVSSLANLEPVKLIVVSCDLEQRDGTKWTTEKRTARSKGELREWVPKKILKWMRMTNSLPHTARDQYKQ